MGVNELIYRDNIVLSFDLNDSSDVFIDLKAYFPTFYGHIVGLTYNSSSLSSISSMMSISG